MNRTFVVVVRNAARERVGAVNFTSLAFTSRLNDVGDWTLDLASDDQTADILLDPSKDPGVLIYDRSDMATPLFTGPVSSIQETKGPSGFRYTVSGPDDNYWLKAREVYQEPTATPPTQGVPPGGGTAHSYYVQSGPAETVVKNFVEVNAGQTALTARRKLTVIPTGPSPRGAMVVGKGRMEPGLLALVQGLSATGGIGFNVRQSGTGPELNFDTFVAVDRTASIRFGLPFGNITEYSYTENAPTVTYVIAGASGTGTGRVFRDMADADALTRWPGRRAESYIDQSNTVNADELDQAMLEELLSGGPSVSVTLTTRDTPTMRLWRDYNLGDRVSVMLPKRDGSNRIVEDVVREFTATETAADGVKVVTKVGTSETTDSSAVAKRLRALQRKVSDVNTVD